MQRASHFGNGLALLTIGLVAILSLIPAPASAWWNHDWSARRTITIDTSPAGASITDPIGTTPVLIRLDVGDFAFDGANPDGSDLRFIAADDKTRLAYHLEKYDHLLGQAFIWVNMPNLAPGVATSMFLYYGNPKATAGDDPKSTYDANMTLVYHFGEHNVPAKDWTSHGNNSQTPAQADDFALIGPGMRLDGQTPVTIPATPSLAWAGGNAFTWSVWFNETALQPDAILYSRTDGTSTVQIGIDNGVPFVAVTNAAGTTRSSGGAAITAASWHHLAVVTGPQMTLYVDGAVYGTLAAPLPALNTIAYLGGDATTGTAAAAPPAPATTTSSPAIPPAAPAGAPAAGAPAAGSPAAATPAAATTGFIGSLDELEISNIARPLGFIKLAAIGQGSNPLAAKLLTVNAEEKPASFFSGPLVIILGAVTPDGWGIIGILIIMAVASWVVMADKISYVNRVDKANNRFIKRFQNLSYDLTTLEQHGTTAADTKSLGNSPLYGIYQIGVRELRQRFAHATHPGDRLLSAQSIAAIRSALDTGMVRQSQRLNKSMVLLTIAIAGGPFLGLLGTVVGVMITFATIAEAGDVNVNAIAPGISAALVATVAGLVVAIPALFGYNYLNSRIRAAIADMQVFVDEFETKMAEYYSPSTVAARDAAE